MTARIRLVVAEYEGDAQGLAEVLGAFRGAVPVAAVLAPPVAEQLPPASDPSEEPVSAPDPNRNGTRPRPKPRKPKDDAPATARQGDDRKARALALWRAGQSVAEIADAVGVSNAAIYQWRAAGNWPPRGKPGGPRYRCQACQTPGTDAKTCEHCGVTR